MLSSSVDEGNNKKWNFGLCLFCRYINSGNTAEPENCIFFVTGGRCFKSLTNFVFKDLNVLKAFFCFGRVILMFYRVSLMFKFICPQQCTAAAFNKLF